MDGSHAAAAVELEDDVVRLEKRKRRKKMVDDRMIF